MSGRPLVALALVHLAAIGAAAQDAASRAGAPPLRVSSAVAPETVTVGDRFRSVLQVVVPAGATVDFSPLVAGDNLQPVDSVRVIPGRSGEPPIAAYSLVAWVAGTPLRAQAPVRVQLAAGTAATYLVPLRLPVVASVLPADTAGVEPRPARGVLALPEGGRRAWPWLLALAAALLGGAAAWRLARRRPLPPEQDLSARERALASLARAAASGADPDAVDAFYAEATGALRRYAAELCPGWGTDLTTRELLERLWTDGVSSEAREELRALLHHADRVKFARYSPSRREVRGFLADARRWVEAYPPPEVSSPGDREAA